MNEADYLELNYLLLKYRILCFKKYSSKNIRPKYREIYLKQIRNIDNIRRQIPLIIDEEK